MQNRNEGDEILKRKAAFITIIVILLTMLTACDKSEKQLSVTELLDLGEKYLLEMNYKQAVVQFLKIIEIEPKNTRGYTGAAEAYIGLGETEKAESILKQGLEVLPGNRDIQAKLTELKRQSLQQWIPDLTTDEKQLCSQLMNAFSSKDSEGIYSILSSEKFLSIIRNSGVSHSFSDGSQKFDFDYGDTVNGMGYSITYNEKYKSLMAFWGGWDNGLGNGEGILIALHFNSYPDINYDDQYTLAQSYWNKGFADGKCETRTVWLGGKYEADGRYENCSGTLSHSLWTGILTEESWFVSEGEGSYTHVQSTFVNGLPTKTGTDDLFYGIDIDTGEPTYGAGNVDGDAYYSATLHNSVEKFSDNMFMISSIPYRLNEDGSVIGGVGY